MLHDERMCGRGMMCQGRVQSVELSVKHGSQDEETKRICHKGGRRRGPSDRRAPIGRRGTHRSRRAPLAARLRPANVRGRRAPGMRAPRNTNQFLMHEKYQLLHMRSDSVGTDSSSDCELDPADMDSYLGVLENAHGALLDSPELQFTASDTIHFFGFAELEREDSMQYFPSENDFMQSEDFMQRDFKQFCDAVACT
ncbi:coiled-coil domain-containing glutamate-rich protein 1 [Silurus asotus]|uniref:Coiled-coil domain-containing glutamate-rich protein 1 n=1 Tax=Silurus asotus TaxID=30991 RepID=A0AAD5A0N3_SILAS|nr:coiled-coil domain-containing glutamate-rich protein 1 [Silurus asotus]